MFVRWKKRKLKSHWHPRQGNVVLSAQLVECKRVDGKPRQNVIKYLGSIWGHVCDAEGRQSSFWRTADRALDELALDAGARRKIEGRLLETVPRPSLAYYAGCAAVKAAVARDPGITLSGRIAAFEGGRRSAQESPIGGLS